MKISTIFFDLGKVLVHFSFDNSIQKISEKSPYSPEEIASISSNDPTMSDYELGKISSQDFFAYLKTLLKYEGSIDEIQYLWSDIFTPIDQHIELARILAINYPLGIISNTSEAHIQFLTPQCEFFNYFKDKIYSYEVGMLKPDKSIYQLAVERMQADPLECLFIDDLEANVLTPSRMGWQTIHLRPDVNLLEALRSYDLKGL